MIRSLKRNKRYVRHCYRYYEKSFKYGDFCRNIMALTRSYCKDILCRLSRYRQTAAASWTTSLISHKNGRLSGSIPMRGSRMLFLQDKRCRAKFAFAQVYFQNAICCCLHVVRPVRKLAALKFQGDPVPRST